MKNLLNAPAMYQMFQVAGGFFSARIHAIHQYLSLQPGQRIIDIGCGPGHILTKLPEGVVYDGFDIDPTYIAFATRHFGHKGRFHCRLFDADAAKEFGPADAVMMNGVLHHLDDDSVRKTASLISETLKPGGFFFALDGVYVPGQSAIAKWFLDTDRGEFVRTEQGYRDLLSPILRGCEFYVRHDLTRVPYSLIISKCRTTAS